MSSLTGSIDRRMSNRINSLDSDSRRNDMRRLASWSPADLRQLHASHSTNPIGIPETPDHRSPVSSTRYGDTHLSFRQNILQKVFNRDLVK